MAEDDVRDDDFETGMRLLTRAAQDFGRTAEEVAVALLAYGDAMNKAAQEMLAKLPPDEEAKAREAWAAGVPIFDYLAGIDHARVNRHSIGLRNQPR